MFMYYLPGPAGEAFETDPEIAGGSPHREVRPRYHEPGEVGRMRETYHPDCWITIPR